VERTTRPEAPRPVKAPVEIMEMAPRAEDLGVVLALRLALWVIPVGVVPSEIQGIRLTGLRFMIRFSSPMKEAPHCDERAGEASSTIVGTSVLMTLYAPLTQFEQTMSLGTLSNPPPNARFTMLLTLRVPTAFSMLVRISVIQFVLPLEENVHVRPSLYLVRG